ncbi:hypothetical protein [Billgrantia endophytica]|nr:hypothetical protein [Halomonas endophytica]
MANKKRDPLSDEEIEFLALLANGNALARQRKRDREKALRDKTRRRWGE